MMRDFTLKAYGLLLDALKEKNYKFQTFEQFLKNPEEKTVILRHDVDAKKMNSLVTAEIEHELGICGTYYFRIVPQSFDPDIIRKIYSLGHEIGYHYEDLAIAKGDYEKAIRLFESNLDKLRQIVPIKTICMHGSPLSRYDNRNLWKKFNYRNYGIIGEPYLDIDFNKIWYLTDTGRRWDGYGVNVRDKVISDLRSNYSTTNDIIKAINNASISHSLMITIHPQRWHKLLVPWICELVQQKLKNIIKNIFIRKFLLFK